MASEKRQPHKCNAKLRKSNPPRYCARYPMPNGRCHLHGGKSLKGPASGTYRGKGYSRYFPGKKLGKIFARSFEDPELMRLRNDLAIVATRLVELIQSLNSGQSGTLRKRLRKKYRELRRSRPNSAKFTKAINEIGELIECGSSNDSIWKEIGQQIELRRRLLDSETKRSLVADQVMTAEEVYMIGEAIGTVIRKHVKDRQTLQKISEEVAGLIDRGNVKSGPTTRQSSLSIRRMRRHSRAHPLGSD